MFQFLQLLGAGCLAVGIWAYVDSQSLAGALGNIPQDNDQSATEAVDAPSLLERGQWGENVTLIFWLNLKENIYTGIP